MKIKMVNNHSFKFATAADESDKLLFRHCAEGYDTVSPGRFEKVVKPLLMAHGVKEIRIV